jgi:hypothetical protein
MKSRLVNLVFMISLMKNEKSQCQTPETRLESGVRPYYTRSAFYWQWSRLQAQAWSLASVGLERFPEVELCRSAVGAAGGLVLDLGAAGLRAEQASGDAPQDAGQETIKNAVALLAMQTQARYNSANRSGMVAHEVTWKLSDCCFCVGPSNG